MEEAYRLDFVVFGATGFAGKYVLEEVFNVSKSRRPLTFGVAGRSKQRLRNLLEEVEEKLKFDVKDVEVIEADASNPDQLAAMAKRARVVLNCCGPFRLYGDAVVKACVNNGANHVDISGEPQYMEEIQQRYHKAAEEAGVYIVSACGLDSIPADLGLVFLEREFQGQLHSVEAFYELYVEGKAQGPVLINYATYESVVHAAAAAAGQILQLGRQQYPDILPSSDPKLPVRLAVHKSQIVNKWYFAFFSPDRPVMQRTQRYLYAAEGKRPVQVSSYLTLPSFGTALLCYFLGITFMVFTSCGIGRKILLRNPKFFTARVVSREGPTQQDAENTIYNVTLVGKGSESVTSSTNKELVVMVTCRNPVYGSTATMLVLSALTILDEADRMPGRGGVLSTGAAFRHCSLIDQLNEAGVTFRIVPTC